MERFSKFFEYRGAILNTGDLLELEKLILEDLGKEADFEITVSNGYKHYISEEMVEIISKYHSKNPERIFISAQKKKKESKWSVFSLEIEIINTAVRIFLGCEKESTFIGFKSKLDTYFNNKKPWYCNFKIFLSIVSVFLLFSSLIILPLSIYFKSFPMGLVGVCFLMLSFTYMYFERTGKILKLIYIDLGEPKKSYSYFELAFLSTNILVFISTILSIIY